MGLESLGARPWRPQGLMRLRSRPEIVIQWSKVACKSLHTSTWWCNKSIGRLEAIWEKVAMSGSNSVNVFLGIGIPGSVGAVPVPQL